MVYVDLPLQTDRFMLRTLGKADATDRYASWFDDIVVSEFIEWKPQGARIRELERYIALHNNRADSLLVGIFTHDGEHIGNLKFEPIDDHSGEAVVGVLVGSVAWRGQGVFQEVFPPLARYLKESRGIRTLRLGVNTSNAAALRAYSKMGFKIDAGEACADGECVWMKVSVADVLRSETED